jgi:hypothetical protein
MFKYLHKQTFAGQILFTLLLGLTGSPNFPVRVNGHGWGGLQFTPVLYTVQGFLQAICSACYLLHAGFLLGLLFNTEDMGDMFLQNINLHRTAWC